MAALLEVKGLKAFYGQTQVLFDLGFDIAEGGITTLLGANGAGKTTTLRAICNMVRTEGSIRFAGQDIIGRPTEEIVRQRIAHVPEGRGTFTTLTVDENLRIAAYTRKDKGEISANLDKVYTYFPRLKTRRTSQAAYTSGGEQQMCAIGRALMSKPTMILLDEPSMGLAPQVVEQIFEIVRAVNEKEHVSFLLAEQNTNMALKYATYGYILENGRIVLDGSADDLKNNADVKEFYLGIAGADRKSFKDFKSYKRRKRWLA